MHPWAIPLLVQLVVVAALWPKWGHKLRSDRVAATIVAANGLILLAIWISRTISGSINIVLG